MDFDLFFFKFEFLFEIFCTVSSTVCCTHLSLGFNVPLVCMRVCTTSIIKL